MDIQMMRHFQKYLLLPLLIIGLVSCEKDSTTDPDETPNICNPPNSAGELISSELFLTVTPELLEQYLIQFGAPISITAEYTVEIHTLEYRSRDLEGNLVPASGVLFLPLGLDTLDLASAQHGTLFRREDAPSVVPFAAIDGLLMAAKGTAVVAPDYLGLGVSDILHPFLHAELTANSVVDILRTARIYACENDLLLSDKLFLAGYSEGGFATLAAQRNIETRHSEEFSLTAVVPMAGPYDPLGTTTTILSQEYYPQPAFLAYMVVAYNDVYGWDILDEVFAEPYAAIIPDLFDGTKSGEEINGALTSRVDSLFNADFIDSFLNGEEPELEAALIENGFSDWGPIAPVLLIHGTGDETVPYENSVNVQASMLQNGGVSVDLIPIPGADHLEAVLPSFSVAQAWIEDF